MTTVPSKEDVLALLDVDKYRAWLESKPREFIVGFCQQPGECPVAAYLADKGVPSPSVLRTAVWWVVGRHEGVPIEAKVPMPNPFYRFIKKVDRLHPALAQITAGEALAVLDQVVTWGQRAAA